MVVKINIMVFRTVTPYRCLNPEAGGSKFRDKTEAARGYIEEGEIPVFCKSSKQ